MKSQSLKLFLLGFLTLFLELVLIRYLAGNIWNLGYFPNLVLIGVFIGMGIGFLFHQYISEEKSGQLFQSAVLVLLLLIVFVDFMHPAVPGFSKGFGDLGGELFFTSTPVKAEDISLWPFIFWFLSVIVIFAMISQRTAKIFRLFPPLKAYTLDISGSCFGILCFMAISWFQIPAYDWFLLLIPVLLLIADKASRKLKFLSIASIVVIAALAWYQDTTLLSYPAFNGKLDVTWSPYQKIEYIDEGEIPHRIFVNGVYHQNMNYPDKLQRSFYVRPHQERQRANLPPYKNVLVIGAGSGNDVATALLNGAEHIDAVEIDPVIARLGKEHHPAHPYDDPRVNLVINDARAFMTNSKNQYDLIIFALTDSLVKVSPMSQLRLENYIFTEDSIRKAYSLLRDHGDLLFYNHYRQPWLLEKIQLTIHDAVGKFPIILRQQGDFAMLMVGRNSEGEPATLQEHGVEPATDDWPFPYLRERLIPRIYVFVMAGLASFVILLVILVQLLGKREEGESGLALKIAFLFMGVAFLLLETKSVIQFSLLFGTTWLNNSLVFLGVLILVLLANWTAAWIQRAWLLPVSYFLLVGMCLIVLWFPLSNLLNVSNPVLRFALASLLTFSPIFFANLIFSTAFRNQKLAEHLFGWNLIGATIGGILEYVSMVTGYNALTAIVAACYTLVILMLFLDRRRTQLAHSI